MVIWQFWGEDSPITFSSLLISCWCPPLAKPNVGVVDSILPREALHSVEGVKNRSGGEAENVKPTI